MSTLNFDVDLTDYLHHQQYYKRISIDLSRKSNTSIPQYINFTEKLEDDDSATVFLITEK